MVYSIFVRAIAVLTAVLLGTTPLAAQESEASSVQVGTAAYGDWRTDAPGVLRRIMPADLPAPSTAGSAINAPEIVNWAASAIPRVPPGFTVARFATRLTNPRIVRVAPNGDIFVAESGAGRIRAMRTADGAVQPQRTEIFARGLDRPFGMAFYPPGPDPQWLYVANNNFVERFPYRNGDLAARGNAQAVVSRISDASGYHWTRDVAFSQDGTLMYASVGAGSNDAEDMGRLAPAAIKANEAQYGTGTAWGNEAQRADVLVFDPEGGNRHIFATGLRNCVGAAVQPQTGDVVRNQRARRPGR